MKIKLKKENVEGYITRIQRELHIADSQTDIPVSAAIGYAWTSEKEKNLEKLLHEADEAMYENKKELKKERQNLYGFKTITVFRSMCADWFIQ
ncbi:diguanylate cyclase domain-containing protein [Blautia wexlerae]|uniref:diguanylate cyclase domain-containing protein n=1 Tax=Blautia wexlerae TaxID=418240 RepID=UPI0015A5AAB8